MVRRHWGRWSSPAAPPASCGGALRVWNVDSEQTAQHGFDFDNRVNAGPIHGLEPIQADGFGNLDADAAMPCGPQAPLFGCSDRGDAGDVYPGTTGNASLSTTTLPSDGLNSSGCPGFSLDAISQVVPNGAIRFVLNTGPQSLAVTTEPHLPSGLWGYAYNTVLSAACGAGAYTWAVTSGAAGPGLAVSQGGVVSGWATDTGADAVQVRGDGGARSAARGMQA